MSRLLFFSVICEEISELKGQKVGFDAGPVFRPQEHTWRGIAPVRCRRRCQAAVTANESYAKGPEFAETRRFSELGVATANVGAALEPEIEIPSSSPAESRD